MAYYNVREGSKWAQTEGVNWTSLFLLISLSLSMMRAPVKAHHKALSLDWYSIFFSTIFIDRNIRHYHYFNYISSRDIFSNISRQTPIYPGRQKIHLFSLFEEWLFSFFNFTYSDFNFTKDANSVLLMQKSSNQKSNDTLL